MRRNIFGSDIVQSVLVPVLGGAAGFVGARYLGNMLAMKDWGTTDPKMGKLIAMAVGIPGVFVAAKKMGAGSMIAKNSGAIVLGMGMAAAEAYIRDTPLLGGGRAAAALTNGNGGAAAAPPAEAAAAEASAEASGDGLSAYYTRGMLGSLGDPADQAQVERSMDLVEPEAIATITPTDSALVAGNWPQERRVSQSFASGDRGYAGGIYARHLFSGMMGG
jgi:hypothetical protein